MDSKHFSKLLNSPKIVPSFQAYDFPDSINTEISPFSSSGRLTDQNFFIEPHPSLKSELIIKESITSSVNTSTIRRPNAKSTGNKNGFFKRVFTPNTSPLVKIKLQPETLILSPQNFDVTSHFMNNNLNLAEILPGKCPCEHHYKVMEEDYFDMTVDEVFHRFYLS